MAAFDGQLLIVKLNGVAIAGTVSNEIQTEAETIEVSSPAQGQWREVIAGRKSWSVTVNFLVMDGGTAASSATATSIKSVLQAGQTYTLRFMDNPPAGSSQATGGVEGPALLKACRITATRGSLVTGTFQFVGAGQLSAIS